MQFPLAPQNQEERWCPHLKGPASLMLLYHLQSQGGWDVDVWVRWETSSLSVSPVLYSLAGKEAAQKTRVGL